MTVSLPPSVIAELGLRCETGGEIARGHTEIQPTVCVPDTGTVRTSVLATWSDVLTGAAAEPFAFSVASFIASPDPSHVFEDGFPDLSGMWGTLPVPLMERLGASVPAPGTALVPHRHDALNAAGAIQGGMVALAAEEARAVATGDDRMSLVHLTDAGSGKLGAVATVRLGDPDERKP